MLLEGWAREGLTDEQIAQKIGICRDTLNEWKKRYPDISDTLKRGKEVVDFQVEKALLNRALGYDYFETIVEKRGDVEYAKKVKKHVPGDTTAQIFWLKNRKPRQWRDRVDFAALPDEREESDILKALKAGVTDAGAQSETGENLSVPEDGL